MAVRVLVGPMPRLLRELVVSCLAASGDIELLREPAPGESYEDAARERYPDVLVTGQDDVLEAPSFCSLLCELPELRILAVRNDGRAASVSELRLRQKWIRSLTPERIISEVLGAGRSQPPQI